MEGLKSFYNRSRIEYDDFRRLFKLSDIKQLEQLCLEYKVTVEDVTIYEKLLRDRIQSVDDMIYTQFEKVKGIIWREQKKVRDAKIEQA